MRLHVLAAVQLPLNHSARCVLVSGCHLGKPLLPSSPRSAPTATHPLPSGDVISLPCAGNATSGESPFDLLSRRSDLSILFKAALAAGDEFIKTLNGQWLVGWWGMPAVARGGLWGMAARWGGPPARHPPQRHGVSILGPPLAHALLSRLPLPSAPTSPHVDTKLTATIFAPNDTYFEGLLEELNKTAAEVGRGGASGCTRPRGEERRRERVGKE